MDTEGNEEDMESEDPDLNTEEENEEIEKGEETPEAARIAICTQSSSFAALQPKF